MPKTRAPGVRTRHPEATLGSSFQRIEVSRVALEVRLSLKSASLS